MFCQKCGAYNAENSNICGSCGAPIEKPEADSAQTNPAPQCAQENPTTEETQRKTVQAPKYVAANTAAQPAALIKDYFVQAILVTLLCNSIFGAVALVFSVLTSTALKTGEQLKAEIYSQKTKLFCWIGFWVGIAVIILIFCWVFFLLLSIGMSVGSTGIPRHHFYY